MSQWELPERWGTLKTGETVEMKTGFACAKKNLVPAGLPHLRPFNIGTDGELDLTEVYYIPEDFKQDVGEYALGPGHVLFNNTNSVKLVGKTAIVRQPLRCAYSNHVTRLTVVNEACLRPEWLGLALRQLWGTGFFEANCNKWIGQAGFNTEMLSNVEVPVPHPDEPERSLIEQSRIVARVETLLAEVAEAQRLHLRIIEDTDQVMNAVLVEIVDQLYRSSPEATIRQLKEKKMLTISGGGTPSKQKPGYWVGNIPWVSPKDMKCWIITDSEDHITSEAIEKSSAKLIPKNSVLVVVRGMILARTWPVAIAEVDLAINQDMKALIPNRQLRPAYLGYVLRGLMPKVLAQVETAAHGTKRLKTEVLEALRIPIPSELEQRRVVAYLDTVQAEVQAMEAIQARDRQWLEQVERAILTKAFQGEL